MINDMTNANRPLLGFAAISGTGKTTLLVQILPLLKKRGIRVGMIKHAHHRFDIDKPGKDSYKLRQAGAEQMLIASRHRWALMVETPQQQQADPQLNELLLHLDQDAVDLILVEGFKQVRFPKIELHRPALGHELLFPNDAAIIAIATDAPLAKSTALPLLDLNDPAEITDFIEQRFLSTN